MTRKWRLVRTAFIIVGVWLVIEIAQNIGRLLLGRCPQVRRWFVMVTPQRSIRINEELWRKAKEKAESEGKNISEVIVAYLKDYA
jgi:hypothetical protein